MFDQQPYNPPIYTSPKPPRRKGPRLVMALILVAFLALGVGYNLGSQASSSPLSGGPTPYYAESGLHLDVLFDVKDYLGENFLYDDRLDDEVMGYGAVKGLVASLEDFYTDFFDPEEAKEFRDFLFTELEGIGAELTIGTDGILTVVSPLKGNPAEKAGILPKDKILEIDGEPAGSDLFDAVKRIKGESGTEVCLLILHEEESEPVDICIVRQYIDIPAVEWEALDNDIYHISLITFDDTVSQELRKILMEIREKSPRGIILDLRFNGGGFLDGATKIASLFLPADKKVTEVDARNGRSSHAEFTYGAPIMPDIPLVLLVNGGSASASEIVAAAFQYYGRTTVIGESTFGKTTAQEVIDLPDGSLLRLTIAKWLTPGGETLDEGLTPDIEVSENLDTENDEQLDKAISVLEEEISGGE